MASLADLLSMMGHGVPPGIGGAAQAMGRGMAPGMPGGGLGGFGGLGGLAAMLGGGGAQGMMGRYGTVRQGLGGGGVGVVGQTGPSQGFMQNFYANQRPNGMPLMPGANFGLPNAGSADAFINAPGGPAEIMRRSIAANNAQAQANAWHPYQMPGMAQQQMHFGDLLNSPGMWSGMRGAVANRGALYGGG